MDLIKLQGQLIDGVLETLRAQSDGQGDWTVETDEGDASLRVSGRSVLASLSVEGRDGEELDLELLVLRF